MNVLITGASSGIGEALAYYYAKKKKVEHLFICGRNQIRLNRTKIQCEKFGIQVHAKILDVTSKEEMKTWIEECENIAPLNLVIANAGVATMDETPANVFNTFNTNVNGMLNTIIPTIEIFKTRSDKNKQIAMLSSIAGYHGLSTCPSYSASKACIKAYGEGLRGSLRHNNIKVNVICPGFIRSGITDKNTCPMPFFMEARKAAHIIAKGLNKNKGLIAFPAPMRFAAWIMNVLPNSISSFISNRLPNKIDD